jgi:hypothetical protein
MRRLSNLLVFALAALAGDGAFLKNSVAQTTLSPMANPAPSAAVSSQAPQRIKYFSLEHRSSDQIDEADRRTLQSRKRELTDAAEIYGYEIAIGEWIYDQALCPAFPDVILLHYLQKFPDGTESLFTALVPRSGGRVRIVPVLYRNASPYQPAVKNPVNFALFNQLVPADAAKNDAVPGGNWLSLGVCYAEMVGARPNVPDQPDLDVATIRAPVAAIRLDAKTGESQVQFSDRDAQKVYTIWTISFNDKGRVIAAINEDYATYVARIVQPPAPAGTRTPAPTEPPSKITPALPEPPAKITPTPPGPQ